MSQDDRQQQYIQLLQKILDEPQQTSEILSNHQELLDQGFLELMAKVAAKAQDNGQDDIAEFLANLVTQLGEALELDRTKQSSGEEKNQEAYLQFLMQLLQMVNDSQGNSQIVYPFLQRNLQYLDETLGRILQQWTIKIFSQVQLNQSIGIAGNIADFGNLINQFPSGQHWLNLELCIMCYKTVLQNVSREQQPQNWAGTQNNLATAYKNRIKGERTDNLELAIAAYQQALKVYTREAFPVDWAMTQNNLANAYTERIKGERADNVEEAIIILQLALEVYTREAFPEQWAVTQNNLALAYSGRIKGERAKNIERAIKGYQLALEVRTREAFSKDWAGIQNNLATAYQDRIKGERADNIEEAIIILQLALEVYTHEAFPEQWAMTQNNLANAYSKRIKGERAENIEAAITAYQLTLQVYTYEAFPIDWAMTQNNLAAAYSSRIKRERAENVEAAIASYELALKVRTRKAFPEQWAETQNNWAAVYKDRKKGERTANIEAAIAAYQLALEVRTREAFPVDWAITQNNLATVYQDRIKGERADNLEEAISGYELALQVRTYEAFPVDWAATQHNLGLAYKDRIKGERADNIEAAITCHKNALIIRTVDAFPLDCLQSSRNLGNLYFSEKQWSEAVTTYELAIKAIEVSRNIAVSDSRRQEIIAESITVFFNITRSHIELNQIDQALTYAERGKARNLTELLASRELYPKGDIALEIIEKLKQLRSQIPTLDRQLQILESNRNNTNPLNQQAREQITAELKQARSELDKVLGIIQPIDPTFTLTQTVQPITFSEIQDLLDNQTAIVEWYITNENTFVFLITKDQTQPILHTIETKIIAEAFQKYLELYNQSQRFTDAAAKDQFETSWTAIREALQLDKIFAQLQQFSLSKLILIPHRQLHFLPLHALPLSDGSCLLDHFPAGVSYAPSCQLLQVLERQEKSATEHFFAIKNPTQDLLFSELEVETISEYFAEIDILDRNNASETAFRNHPNLDKLNCLHFSCHGKFDANSPLNSALILNKEANEDNRLTLAEIFELNLPNCNLVTLSACETGITDLSSLGDEYIGLPSGFIYAGASAVISSLWPVSDLATAILLIKTYQNLKQDSYHVAVALNQAQQWLQNLTIQEFDDFLLTLQPKLNKLRPGQKAIAQTLITKAKARGNKPFSHPYYWAAFTVTGI